MMDRLRLVSLKCRGYAEKRHKIFRWLADHKYNIIPIQETYCTQSVIYKFNYDWYSEVLHSICNSEQSNVIKGAIDESEDTSSKGELWEYFKLMIKEHLVLKIL